MPRAFIFLLKMFGIVVLASIMTGVGWIMYGTHRYYAFHAPEHVPDIAHYIEYYGLPETIYLKRLDGAVYYGLIAPRGNFATLVSGPPVFLYDQQGKLWDYNLNSGDEPFAKGGFSLGRFDGQVENPKQTIRRLSGEASEAVMESLDEIIYIDDGQLCSTTIDGHNKPRCIESDNEYQFPAWHPDGNSIVVESADSNDANVLMLLGAEGKPLRQVEDSTGFTRPVWSPDGQYLYAINRKLGAAIGRWDSDGSNFRSIPVSGIPEQGALGAFESIQMISISPNGTTVAMLAEGFHHILVASEIDGNFQVTGQLPEGFASVGMSVWRDASHLLFVGNLDPRRSELWKLNIQGGTTEKIEITGLHITDGLSLSPDKKSVVICGAEKGNKDVRWNLWRYSFASTELKRLTNGDEDSYPNWSRRRNE